MPKQPDQPTPVINSTARSPQGNTLAAQGQTQEPVPRTPNERDESADSQGAQEASGQRMGQQDT